MGWGVINRFERLLQRRECHVYGFAPDDLFRIESRWVAEWVQLASDADVECSSVFRDIDEIPKRDLFRVLRFGSKPAPGDRCAEGGDGVGLLVWRVDCRVDDSFVFRQPLAAFACHLGREIQYWASDAEPDFPVRVVGDGDFRSPGWRVDGA